MAEQSFLMKLGMRLGVVGSSAALALAAPIANANYSTTAGTAANRTGIYFDQTAAAEKIGYVVGGQTGPLYTRNGTKVDVAYSGAFSIASGVSPVINGAAGTVRALSYSTGGVFRWQEAGDVTAESGGTLGTDLLIQSFSDAGALLTVCFDFRRLSTSGIKCGASASINTGATGAFVRIASNAATTRQMQMFTTVASVGSTRWNLNASNGAESGSDAGSNWVISAYDDSSAQIGSPMSLTRAALGTMTLARPIIVASGTLTGAQSTLSVAGTWNNGATTFTGWKINLTNTASAVGTLMLDLQVGGISRFNVASDLTSPNGGAVTVSAVDTDLLASPIFSINRTTTITAGVPDGYIWNNANNMAVNGAFTVTRYNYIELDTPTGTSPVTDACVFNFDAAAGTHKCVDAATTKTTPGTVNAWMVTNINGTLYYAPIYSSKTT